MGTSSNWAFGRRVLNMAHLRCTGQPLSNEGLLFDCAVYDLKWDGNRLCSPDYAFDISDLPTKDHAIYLINSVKFHCGRLFYLFDEEIFMERFSSFHDDPHGFAQQSPLWYVHYLLILAFGKVFLAQTRKSHPPVGTELFVQAMKLMPDFTYYKADPVEETQVLCCIALWLQVSASNRFLSQYRAWTLTINAILSVSTIARPRIILYVYRLSFSLCFRLLAYVCRLAKR